MNSYKKNRREFMKLAGLIGAGLSTNASSLFQLKNMSALAGQHFMSSSGDYKALVCLYLGGGADSFNMLVPRGQTEYQDYAATRSNLALDRDSLLSITPLNISGVEYGLHPAMTGIRQLFDEGKLCMISNVGTLVEPVTKEAYYNNNVRTPLGLYSHSDQTNQWHTASSAERLIKGWAGRVSDMVYDLNDNDVISLNVSFNGSNTFQSSNINVEYSVNSDGAIGLTGYGGMYGSDPIRTRAVDQMMARSYGDPFKDTYARKFRQSLEANLQFNEAVWNVPDFNTSFTNSYLSENFAMIARIIAAREALGFKRQIFFINFGGWDNHDELLNNQNANLRDVDRALFEFNQAIEEIGMSDSVVTFTMSEFGRTLTSNGNGTDHAWGGNVMAMGGPVQGNRLFGTYPSLALGNDLDLGGGVLIPTTATDLYFAELALWFGIQPGELSTVFPNLTQFYDPMSGQPPIGFL